jgi:hypothetical protein
VAFQKVRQDKDGSKKIIIHFSVEMGMLIITEGQAFFIHNNRIRSAVKSEEFISDRMSYVNGVILFSPSEESIANDALNALHVFCSTRTVVTDVS